jgi:hypothetical protein
MSTDARTNDLISTNRSQSPQCSQKHRPQYRRRQTPLTAKRAPAWVISRNNRDAFLAGRPFAERTIACGSNRLDYAKDFADVVTVGVLVHRSFVTGECDGRAGILVAAIALDRAQAVVDRTPHCHFAIGRKQGVQIVLEIGQCSRKFRNSLSVAISTPK